MASANNKASALTYGFEISVGWKPLNRWRLQGNYSYLELNISSNELFKLFDPSTGGANKVNPQHQLSVRSNIDTLDAKLAFKPHKNAELFLIGQNLFSQNHREFVAHTIPPIPGTIPRGIYAGARWQF
ncbi:iron complex outermembrane recepter protein [Nitrosomonas sp. Nm51]|uniref:TonB-dependent receptor n=1 Tax=Nitrosomonas sp. Nm51 TaxID=133720 RepID=UPI0008AD5E49|nr:TonB-dependent receptor [Nitrosomonas sp. Nm51]SER61360.1 iron complex outermembrane recepter protein [Nitrosomonas sp. Nm51]